MTSAAKISEFHVEMAYRYILGRPPESWAVVRERATLHDSLEQLCESMFRSPEFQARLARIMAAQPSA